MITRAPIFLSRISNKLENVFRVASISASLHKFKIDNVGLGKLERS
jgi:hypothetical protein